MMDDDSETFTWNYYTRQGLLHSAHAVTVPPSPDLQNNIIYMRNETRIVSQSHELFAVNRQGRRKIDKQTTKALIIKGGTFTWELQAARKLQDSGIITMNREGKGKNAIWYLLFEGNLIRLADFPSEFKSLQWQLRDAEIAKEYLSASLSQELYALHDIGALDDRRLEYLLEKVGRCDNIASMRGFEGDFVRHYLYGVFYYYKITMKLGIAESPKTTYYDESNQNFLFFIQDNVKSLCRDYIAVELIKQGLHPLIPYYHRIGGRKTKLRRYINETIDLRYIRHLGLASDLMGVLEPYLAVFVVDIIEYMMKEGIQKFASETKVHGFQRFQLTQYGRTVLDERFNQYVNMVNPELFLTLCCGGTIKDLITRIVYWYKKTLLLLERAKSDEPWQEEYEPNSQ